MALKRLPEAKMKELPKWNYQQLSDIDKLYSKAEEIRREASHLKNEQCNYDLAIRRSQEALELYLKVIFKLIKQDYPTGSRGHELSTGIRAIYERMKSILKYYGFRKEDIVTILRASEVLASWRNLSFYGEEKLEELGIHESFTKKEADLALDYVSKASSLCFGIRDYFYKIAAKQK